MHIQQVEKKIRKKKNSTVNAQKISSTSCMRLRCCFISEQFTSQLLITGFILPNVLHQILSQTGHGIEELLLWSDEVMETLWGTIWSAPSSPWGNSTGHFFEHNKQNFSVYFPNYPNSLDSDKICLTQLRVFENICWCCGIRSLPERCDCYNFNKKL